MILFLRMVYHRLKNQPCYVKDGNLEFQVKQLCPKCQSEMVYTRAVWSLYVMVKCPDCDYSEQRGRYI